jgi:hypothetical protein
MSNQRTRKIIYNSEQLDREILSEREAQKSVQVDGAVANYILDNGITSQTMLRRQNPNLYALAVEYKSGAFYELPKRKLNTQKVFRGKDSSPSRKAIDAAVIGKDEELPQRAARMEETRRGRRRLARAG